MPQTREQKLQKKKEYYNSNKKEILEAMKQYRQENREKRAEYNKQYYQENKEKIAEKKIEYYKQYYQTDQCRKVRRIGQWKHSGLIDSDNDNYESIYDYYINTTQCENCDVELTQDRYNTSTTRCLDHSHITGLFRNILCQGCNRRRGEDNF
tara:strand:+ start:220 stop:675 length:456 start_codon:yes stop_codon:yes gene_type:complete